MKENITTTKEITRRGLLKKFIGVGSEVAGVVAGSVGLGMIGAKISENLGLDSSEPNEHEVQALCVVLKKEHRKFYNNELYFMTFKIGDKEISQEVSYKIYNKYSEGESVMVSYDETNMYILNISDKENKK